MVEFVVWSCVISMLIWIEYSLRSISLTAGPYFYDLPVFTGEAFLSICNLLQTTKKNRNQTKGVKTSSLQRCGPILLSNCLQRGSSDFSFKPPKVQIILKISMCKFLLTYEKKNKSNVSRRILCTMASKATNHFQYSKLYWFKSERTNQREHKYCCVDFFQENYINHSSFLS